MAAIGERGSSPKAVPIDEKKKAGIDNAKGRVRSAVALSTCSCGSVGSARFE